MSIFGLKYTIFLQRFAWIFPEIFDLFLKVSKFQNEFMMSSFPKKYEPNIVRISALYCTTLQGRNAITNTIFGSYFGSNDEIINSFWNLLTFTRKIATSPMDDPLRSRQLLRKTPVSGRTPQQALAMTIAKTFLFKVGRGWSPKFATGLNIIIGIVQKV